jgi:hypothetical protein
MFYAVNNYKTANNSTMTEDRARNNHRFGALRILDIFDVSLIKFKNNQILLNFT